MLRRTAGLVLFVALSVASPAVAGDWISAAVSRLEAAERRSSSGVDPFALALAPSTPPDHLPDLALFSDSRALGLPLFLHYGKPIFRVNVARFEPRAGQPDPVAALAQTLARFSDALRERPRTGHDWAFAHVYSLVTAKELERIASGAYVRPDLVHLEVGQFFEVYAANARAWLGGGTPEPQWAEAARLSRELDSKEVEADEETRNAAASAVLLTSMFAHIAVDLPRCLLLVYYGSEPRPSLDAMKRDFFVMTPLFDEVSEQLLQEGTITPAVMKRLPPLLRELVAVAGVGRVVRLMRRYAWERFVHLAKRQRYRDELLALPGSAELTALPYGAGR